MYLLCCEWQLRDKSSLMNQLWSCSLSLIGSGVRICLTHSIANWQIDVWHEIVNHNCCMCTSLKKASSSISWSSSMLWILALLKRIYRPGCHGFPTNWDLYSLKICTTTSLQVVFPCTVFRSLSCQSQVRQARRVLKQERAWQKAESERASTEWFKARREEELKEATVSDLWGGVKVNL